MAQPKSVRLVTEAALAPVLQDVTDAKGLAESVVSRADSGEFTGADGQDGSNVLTTDQMNQSLIENPASLTKVALDAATNDAIGVGGVAVDTLDGTNQSLIEDSDSLTATSLKATIVDGTGVMPVGAPSGTDDTTMVQAVIDAGAAAIRLQSFATYKIGSLSAPARNIRFVGIGTTITALSANPVIIKNGAYRVAFDGITVNLQSEANEVTDAPLDVQRIVGSSAIRNGRTSAFSVSDEANFAGQGTAARTIGWVKHHYTDSPMMQMDNVGSGTSLTIKNAHNPTRRGDKPESYVGDGSFINLAAHDYAAGMSRSLFLIDKNGRFIWTGDSPTGAIASARLLANKADNGLYAFSFDLSHKHTNVANMFGVFEVRNDFTNTRAVIRSMTAQENGLMLDTTKGDLTLAARAGAGSVSLNGRVKFARAGDLSATAGEVAKYLIVEDGLGSELKIALHYL